MSCNNYEDTTIFFTKSGFNNVIKKIKELYNERESFYYESALSLYDYFLLKKVKKEKDALSLLGENFDNNDNFFLSGVVAKNNNISYCAFHNRLLRELFRGKDGGLTKPRKSAFEKLKTTDRNFSIDVNSGLIHVIDGANGYIIGMTSEENNHAVERFDSDNMVHSIKKYLNKEYKWKRSEGGVTKYNDEYNREMGGGESIRGWFGPLGEKLFYQDKPYLKRTKKSKVRP